MFHKFSNKHLNVIDLFLFKVLNTKLQTHFLKRYQTKPNTALEVKAAFVHLDCIVNSVLLRGRTPNSRERKLCLPHSYCKELLHLSETVFYKFISLFGFLNTK
jgi:hypothetical protein